MEVKNTVGGVGEERYDLPKHRCSTHDNGDRHTSQSSPLHLFVGWRLTLNGQERCGDLVMALGCLSTHERP